MDPSILTGAYYLGKMYVVAGSKCQEGTAKCYKNLEPQRRKQGQVCEDACYANYCHKICEALDCRQVIFRSFIWKVA